MLEDTVNGGKADAGDSFKIYIDFNNWLMYLTQSNGPSKAHMRASCCSVTWRLYKTGICSSKNMNHLTSVLFSIIPIMVEREKMLSLGGTLCPSSLIAIPWTRTESDSGKDFIWNRSSRSCCSSPSSTSSSSTTSCSRSPASAPQLVSHH